MAASQRLGRIDLQLEVSVSDENNLEGGLADFTDEVELETHLP